MNNANLCALFVGAGVILSAASANAACFNRKLVFDLSAMPGATIGFSPYSVPALSSADAKVRGQGSGSTRRTVINFPIELPAGAIINQLRLYGEDPNADGIDVRIRHASMNSATGSSVTHFNTRDAWYTSVNHTVDGNKVYWGEVTLPYGSNIVSWMARVQYDVCHL